MTLSMLFTRRRYKAKYNIIAFLLILYS